MSISSEILTLPILKAFVMTDKDNNPFVLSFHSNLCYYRGVDVYFKVTPNRANNTTKVPVFAGVCYSINSFMDMLTTYGCKYIKRLQIESGEILSKDYLDGLADGTVIATSKPNHDHEEDEEDNWLYDFIDELLDGAGEIDKNGDFELPF